MKLIKFGVREDFGKEFYLALFSAKKYSLLQISFDVGEYSKWTELPYIQICLGNGRLFSLLFTISKFGISFDFMGRSWTDEIFYVQSNQ